MIHLIILLLSAYLLDRQQELRTNIPTISYYHIHATNAVFFYALFSVIKSYININRLLMNLIILVIYITSHYLVVREKDYSLVHMQDIIVVIGYLLVANLVFKENLSPLLIALSIYLSREQKDSQYHSFDYRGFIYPTASVILYHIISVQRNLN